MTDETLIELAKLIRDFHDTAVGLGDGLPTWDPLLGDPSDSTEVICHNDLSIPNTVFRGGHPIALVDWDFAAPGRRLWDLAYAAWWIVPLHRPEFMRSIGWPEKSINPGDWRCFSSVRARSGQSGTVRRVGATSTDGISSSLRHGWPRGRFRRTTLPTQRWSVD